MIDLELLYKLRKIAIMALFSDDYLMDTLVLKGGNALDMVYDISKRGSLDLDFSITGEFSKEDIPQIEENIILCLTRDFSSAGYKAFDIKFEERPRFLKPGLRDFWGGYLISFKIIGLARQGKNDRDIEKQRREAIEVGYRHERKMQIEISKYEYCSEKNAFEMDGMTIYVYSLKMIVIEKIRALCQQTAEYEAIIGTRTATARSKDFFDIYTVLSETAIDINSNESHELIKAVFEAKRVPLYLIGELYKTREMHKQDFLVIKDTLKKGVPIKEFDYYFDYVIDKLEGLKSLWIIDSPGL
jgi:predicted nucleotidyltransferase component of viral defense system